MKLKKMHLLVLLATLCVKFSHGQTFSLDTTAYRPSVITKTKDVFNAAAISASRQDTLAHFFTAEEDSVAAAVAGDVLPEQIDLMENRFILQFQSILSPTELLLYRQERPVSMYARDLSQISQ